MSTIRMRGPAAVLGVLILLGQVQSAWAQPTPAGGEARDFRRGMEVVFTKWLTEGPYMAGLVSGDAGAGHYAGEILAYTPTDTVDTIEALYHVLGSARQLTARVTVVENKIRGTATIRGVVVSGAMRGKRVRGEYQVIAPCGIINAQQGSGGDACYQGTLTIGPDVH